MHDQAAKNWRRARVTRARTESEPMSPAIANRGNLAEQPGADGIRWGLVNRVKAEIAAGLYDTDEKLEQAEERLLARLY